MYVIRLDWFSRIAGNRVEWFRTYAAAAARQRELWDGGEIIGLGRVERVEIPAGQRAIVRWLNQYLCSDNV